MVIWLQELLPIRPAKADFAPMMCKIPGYLAYLSSGNVDEMYRVMWECGKLTREDLGKMCHSVAAGTNGDLR